MSKLPKQDKDGPKSQTKNNDLTNALKQNNDRLMVPRQNKDEPKTTKSRTKWMP